MTQKERIVSEAAAMFAQQGLKSVRMDDIATELCISKRTLYALFEDKEELIYLSLQYWIEQQCQAHLQVMSEVENELEGIFKIMKNAHKNSAVKQRIEGNLKKFYPEVYARIQREGAIKNRIGLKKLLDRCTEKGIFRSEVNNELTLGIFYALCNALIQRDLEIIPESMSDEEAFLQLITTLFRGIATPKGLELIEFYTKQLNSKTDLL